MPVCNSEAMNLRLAEIAKDVAPGRHAVLLVDQAGWHASAKLEVPSNITLMPLPANPPEPQPGGKCLGVHARQLAVKPDFPVL